MTYSYTHPRGNKEATLMATAKKPARSKVVVEVEDDEEDELEELEDELDELEALADEDDEDEVEPDDDDEEDDEEEAPKSRRTKKTSKTAKTEKPAKKKRESTIYGTAELAEDLETDGKNLRVMLRDIGANAVKSKKAPHGSFNEAGRYEWEDLDDALETLGFDSVEDAIERLTEARNTRLDALKERNADKKKTTAKKTTKRTAKVEEPDEDEDLEDEDEDEDEEPAPKKKPATRRRTSK
jgi:hypothetical protein